MYACRFAMSLVGLLRLRPSCANLRSRKLFRCRRPVPQRKPEPCPHIHARLGETIGEGIVVVEALPQSAAACRSPASSLADRKR